MAKATITVSSRIYSAGAREVELPNLTSDDSGIKISMTRESWPVDPLDANTPVLFGEVWYSDDDWVTPWKLLDWSYVGGDMINGKTGQLVTVCGPSVYWPERNGVPQRPARVKVKLTNTVAIRTAITLDGL